MKQDLNITDTARRGAAHAEPSQARRWRWLSLLILLVLALPHEAHAQNPSEEAGGSSPRPAVTPTVNAQGKALYPHPSTGDLVSGDMLISVVNGRPLAGPAQPEGQGRVISVRDYWAQVNEIEAGFASMGWKPMTDEELLAKNQAPTKKLKALDLPKPELPENWESEDQLKFKTSKTIEPFIGDRASGTGVQTTIQLTVTGDPNALSTTLNFILEPKILGFSQHDLTKQHFINLTANLTHDLNVKQELDGLREVDSSCTASAFGKLNFEPKLPASNSTATLWEHTFAGTLFEQRFAIGPVPVMVAVKFSSAFGLVGRYTATATGLDSSIGLNSDVRIKLEAGTDLAAAGVSCKGDLHLISGTVPLEAKVAIVKEAGPIYYANRTIQCRPDVKILSGELSLHVYVDYFLGRKTWEKRLQDYGGTRFTPLLFEDKPRSSVCKPSYGTRLALERQPNAPVPSERPTIPKPYDVKIASTGRDSCVIRWKYDGPTPVSFKAYKSEGDSNAWESLSGNEWPDVDTNSRLRETWPRDLKYGLRYQMKVIAYHTDEQSRRIESASDPVNFVPGTPGAVSNLRAQSVGTEAIQLSWDYAGGGDVSNDIGYYVEWADTENGPYRRYSANASPQEKGSKREFTVTSQPPGERRYFRVWAEWAVPGPRSNPAYAAAGAPPPVTNLRAQDDGADRVYLHWDYDNRGFSKQLSFIVDCSPTRDGSATEHLPFPGTTREARIPNREAGKTYFFRVRAVWNQAESQPSNVAVARVGVPLAPTALVAKAGDPQSIRLDWEHNGSQGIEYFVRRSEAPDGPFEYADSTAWPDCVWPVKNYTDPGLDPKKIYYYTVTATRGSMQSHESNVASAQAGMPPAPENLEVLSCSDDAVRLSWHYGGPKAGVKLHILQAEQADMVGAKVREVVGSEINEYRIDKLELGKNYFFAVRAQWTSQGPNSNLVNCMPGTPAAVTGLNVTATGKNIQLDWDYGKTESGCSFVVEMSERESGPFEEIKPTLGPDARSYLVAAGLKPGKLTYFRVGARRYGLDGGKSAVCSAIPGTYSVTVIPIAMTVGTAPGKYEPLELPESSLQTMAPYSIQPERNIGQTNKTKKILRFGLGKVTLKPGIRECRVTVHVSNLLETDSGNIIRSVLPATSLTKDGALVAGTPGFVLEEVKGKQPSGVFVQTVRFQGFDRSRTISIPFAKSLSWEIPGTAEPGVYRGVATITLSEPER